MSRRVGSPSAPKMRSWSRPIWINTTIRLYVLYVKLVPRAHVDAVVCATAPRTLGADDQQACLSTSLPLVMDGSLRVVGEAATRGYLRPRRCCSGTRKPQFPRSWAKYNESGRSPTTPIHGRREHR